MTLTTNTAMETVHEALVRGVEGDLTGGAELLLPLLTNGTGTQYAVASMLAEIASFITRRDQVSGPVPMLVPNEVTSAGAIEATPPGIAFAAEFTTAWANREHDTAEGLFAALVRTTTGDGIELLDALIALFQMAVATSVEIVAEQRRAAGITGKGPVL